MLSNISSKIQYMRPACRRMFALDASVMAPVSQEIHPTVPPQPKIEEKLLSNGTKVVTRDARVENVTIKVAVNCGSRHELAHEKGAAHLLSVAAFAGTQNKHGLSLMREIENHGFSVGVSADREKTVYSIKSVPEFASDAAAILTEVITSPPKHTYQIKERIPTALYDYELRKSSPRVALTEMLYEAAYGEGTPMGSSCYATNISSLSMDDVMAFRNRHFNASNMTITADGLSLHELELIGFSLGVEGNKSSADSSYVGGVVRRAADFNGEIHASLAFPAATGAKGKAFAVLQTILESRLSAKTVGQGKGCWKSFHVQNSDSGLVGCYMATTTKQHTEDLLALTINELKEIATKVDATAAKNKLSLRNACALEGGDSAASLLLSATYQGMPVSQFINFSSVTNEEVSAAAAAVLKSTPAYAVLGNTFGVQPYDAVRNMLH